MINRLRISCLVALCCSAVAAQAAPASALPLGPNDDGWVERSNQHSMQVLRVLGAFSPEWIASYGLSEFDDQVVDLGPDLDARLDEAQIKQRQQLRIALENETHAEVRRDLQILIQALDDDMEQRQIEREHLLPYLNVHQFVYSSLNSLLDPRNDPKRFPAALQRLQQYVGRDSKIRPITELAKAQSSQAFSQEALLGPYKAELDRDLANSAVFVDGIKAAFERAKLQGWEEDFATLEKILAQYKVWLEKEIVPRARPKSALPAAVYANQLKSFGVRAQPDELIAQAQSAYQSIRTEMKALARQIAKRKRWPDAELVPVMVKFKQSQIPARKVLSVYQKRLREIEKIIVREKIVTLPQRSASIRLATEAESAAVPASFMRPPQIIGNTGQFGEFVLVSSNPTAGKETLMDDWTHEAITWALTVHEARPGHELQYSSIVENGTSLARAIFAFNSANAEGWGLYSEAVMHEYLPQDAQLFSLFTRLMRAARMFLDPMVNTGVLTPAEVEQFLVEQVGLSQPMARSEADRYSFRLPGQATAYYYGYQNLMRLRTELEIKLGDRFDQLAFHDYVLAQGFLPPELLREAVLQKFVP